MSRTQLISQLTTEINDLRLSILYLEKRITRKQIAIQELLMGTDITPEPISQPVPEVAPRVPTVPRMLSEVLGEINGTTFYYGDLRQRILAKHPDAKSKITGLYPAIKTLLTRGNIVRVPGGFQQAHRDQVPCQEATK